MHGMSGCPAACCCADGPSCDAVLISVAFEFSARFFLFFFSEFCG